MKNRIITEAAEVRPLSTYSANYLANRESILKWQKNNRDQFMESVKKHAEIYNKKFPLSVKERCFTSLLRRAFRLYLSGKKCYASTAIRIKEKTGLTIAELINHFGLDNVIGWVHGGNSYQIDHIISLSRLEKAGMMEKASHYTNLRITKREINQQWGNRISAKVSPEVLDTFVKMTVATKLGDN